jgi:2-keto-4-pentenoate hydratase
VLQVNGETVGEGKGADALGNPLAAVAWLADQLAAQGRSLKRGMIVMTGSIVKTYFPKPGDQLDFTVEGLGNTVLRLANA